MDVKGENIEFSWLEACDEHMEWVRFKTRDDTGSKEEGKEEEKFASIDMLQQRNMYLSSLTVIEREG
jgi:hypothetical protein